MNKAWQRWKVLIACAFACFSAGSAVYADSLPNSDVTSSHITEKLNPTELVELLHKRVNNKNFDCARFDKLDEVVCQLFHVTSGINPHVTSNNFKLYFSIAAMNYVQTNISPAKYALISRQLADQFTPPLNDAKVCIGIGYGICGNQTTVFMGIVRRIGIKARPVQFFYTKHSQRFSHIAAEVWIGGWRYFDTTWGAFWYKNKTDQINSIASSQEILKNIQTLHVSINHGDTWFVYNKVEGANPTEYFSAHPSVIYGYNDGIVDIGSPPPKTGKFNLIDVPDYVGDNQSDGTYKGVSYRFPMLKGENIIELQISGIGGCTSEKNQICAGQSCTRIDQKSAKQLLKINASDANSIHIRSVEDICYAVFQSISVKKPTISSRHKNGKN